MKKKYLLLLSFVVPFLILVGCCIGFGVQPFGDSSLLIIDGLHQYMPFYSILYDKLKSGESLFYSFRAGLGINFLSLFSYYLSSPFNLVIVFFKKSQLNMVVSWLIVLKLALSGLTSAIYFSSKSRRPNVGVLAASLAYALSSYMVGYCWNVMWLDAIMIFPLIILGLEHLIEKRDGRLYCIALFYALYCNYYIGFMICIFVVLWYLLYSFKSVRQFFFRGIAFAFYSLLAAAMAAVLLVPAYMGIKQTAAGDEMSLPAHSFYTGFADLLNRQFALGSPITHDNFDGNGNLYIGIFAVLAVGLYLLNREIALAEKIKALLFILLFYVSFNEEIVNFIWHGFHDQYGIPNRFSFLFGFVLLVLFVEVTDHLSGLSALRITSSVLAGVGLLAYTYLESSELMEDAVYGAAGMLFVLYGMLLFLYTLSKRWKRWYKLAFCLVAMVEICVTACMGFDANGQISVSKFFYGTEDMERATASVADGTFYRSELADTLMVDENAWYPLNSIGLFGSTATDQMVNAMDSLGFYTACNEYLYKGATPLTNFLLNVRYLYYHEEDDLATDFVCQKTEGSFRIYENQNTGMSVGYLMNDTVVDWEYDSAYPFRVQNDLCEQAFGISDLFEDIPIDDPEVNACIASRTNDGEYYFEYQDAASDNMTFTIPITEDVEDLYLFYDGTQVENARILVDGELVKSGDMDGYTVPVGSVGAGSKVVVTFQLKGETDDGYVRLSAAGLNRDKFENLTKIAASRALKVESHDTNHIKGTVKASEEQLLFLSIPYDDGWQIKVDGETVDSEIIGDAFLAVEVPAGEHTVELSYTPPGFSVGGKISAVAVGIFAGICVWKWQGSKRGKKGKRKERKGKSA